MKRRKSIFALLVMCMVLMCSTLTYAETKQAELTTLTEQKNIIVSLDFPSEVVDVVFISPSGERKDKNSSDVDYEVSDLHSVYIIKDAESGTWMAEYDKQSNSSIGCTLLDDGTSYGLWVTAFDAKYTSETEIQFDFDVEFDGEDLPYTYEITAHNDEARTSTPLASGNASANQHQSLSVDVSDLQSGHYYYYIGVTGMDRTFEVCDGMETEAAAYEKPQENVDTETTAYDNSQKNSEESSQAIPVPLMTGLGVGTLAIALGLLYFVKKKNN